MNKIRNKDKLLINGLRVIHEQGLAGASVRDIATAAGVPLGSFTNYFASKEAFGLEVIDMYREVSRSMVDATLRNESLSPLQRLMDYVDASRDFLDEDGMRNGCLCGNIGAEANAHTEEVRLKIMEVFSTDRREIAACLKAAIAQNELSERIDIDDVAGFFVSSLQGAFLVAKVERSPEPVNRFKRVFFSMTLPALDKTTTR
ncbi:MAG: TetR family transcriptional regulator C-terminal domain-containing protein [Rhodanobacter sp.]